MNREDQRFWEGFLKGILACELVAGDAKDAEGAMAEIRKLKHQTERLHSEDILMFLRQYKTE